VLGYASGPTVGAFLLGILTRSATTWGTVAGMAFGLGLTLLTGDLVAPRLFHWPGVAWTWNVAIGAAATFAAGLLFSRTGARSPARAGTP